MKLRRYWLALVLAWIASCAWAQIGERRSVLSIGGNAGLLFNSVDFDPTIRQTQHMGAGVGLTLRYTCEKYFTTVCALQVELNYAQLGWKEDILNAYSQELPDTYSRNLSYVQLPLLARLSWGRERGGLAFFILLGPQLGYYISGSEDRSAQWTLNDEGNPDRPNNVYQQYTMEPDNKFEYGLTGGLGLEFSTRKGQHFIVDGRYYYGLSDIYKNGKKDVFARSAHMTIAARFTYLFDLYNKEK